MEQIYDALHGASNVYKFIMENDRVRVLDAHFKPGAKAAMHTHPDHVVYILNDGKLNLTPSKGKTQEIDLKSGQAIWMDATSHAAENPGKTDVHLLVVELKK
jgi:quercetin dioxygenase-like cupin family protein